MFNSFLESLSYLRLTPFDISTDGGRQAERYRLAALAVFANVIAKALALVALIYAVRIALPHLGEERFGVWMTIASVATLLSFMDLGIGNALVTQVAEVQAKEGKIAAARAVSQGLLLLFLVGLCVAVAFTVVGSTISLAPIFKGAAPATLDEARNAAILFGVTFGISFAPRGAFRVFSGLQEAWLGHLINGLFSLLSIGVLFWLSHREGGMMSFLIATYGVQQLSGFVLLFVLARRGMLSFKAMASQFNIIGHTSVLFRGKYFLVIQIAVAIIFGSNQVILSSVVGPRDVAIFVVVQQMFMLVSQPLAILNAPLWAIFADAGARGEQSFLRRMLGRSLAATFVFASIGSAILIAAYQPVGEFLSKGQLALPFWVVLFMGLWTVLETVGNAYAMYLNGLNIVRPQAVTAVLYAAVGVPAKILAVSYFQVLGIPLSLIVCYLLFTILPLTTIFRNECMRPIARN